MSMGFALVHGSKEGEILLKQTPEQLRTELLHRLDKTLPLVTTRNHAVDIAREIFVQLEQEFKDLSVRV